MLTEAIVKTALESVLGYGFSRILKTVFGDGPLGSDEETLRKVLYAIQAHGHAIDNIERRLVQVEEAVRNASQGMLMRPKSAVPLPHKPDGEYFLKVTGGREAYMKRMREK